MTNSLINLKGMSTHAGLFNALGLGKKQKKTSVIRLLIVSIVYEMTDWLIDLKGMSTDAGLFNALGLGKNKRKTIPASFL